MNSMDNKRLNELLGAYRDRWFLLYHYSTYNYQELRQVITNDISCLDMYFRTEKGLNDVFADDLFDFIKAFNAYIKNEGKICALHFLNNMDENRNGKHLSKEMERVYHEALNKIK